MIEDILNLISDRNYSNAYELSKQQGSLTKIYTIWREVYEGQVFENIDRKINFEIFDLEIIETVRLYMRLSKSNWDKRLLSEFRKVAKMLIAETSSELRNISYININGQIVPSQDLYINPQIRISLQKLIEHFNKVGLHESKADLFRIKAQLTLTMNLEKQFVGPDMIQYGNFYEDVKQYDTSIQIYNNVISDFKEALDNINAKKNERLLELNILKEAYEGMFRLTRNTEIQQKLNKLNIILT